MLTITPNLKHPASMATPLEEGISYTLAIYRLGWYQGTGGRLMSSVQLTGKAQGY